MERGRMGKFGENIWSNIKYKDVIDNVEAFEYRKYIDGAIVFGEGWLWW